MHLTRETPEQLTAGPARLVRSTEHLGHRIAADLYGDLPSSGRALLDLLGTAGAQALAHTRAVRGEWAAEALADRTDDEARQSTALLEELAHGLDAAGRRRARPRAVVG